MNTIEQIIEKNIKCCINCLFFKTSDSKKAKCVNEVSDFYDKSIVVSKLASRILNDEALGRMNCKLFI